jgi:predicted nucleic acid-binding protein
MILVDTNITISHVQREHIKLTKERLAISVITYIELLSGYDEKDMFKMKSFLSGLLIVQLTEGIVQQSIEIRRRCRIKTPDAIIAATAMKLNIPLVSGDAVFKKVHGLRLAASI